MDVAWLAVWDWGMDALQNSLGSVAAHIAGYTLAMTQTEEGIVIEAQPKETEVLLAKLHLVAAEPLAERTSITEYQGRPVYLGSTSGPRPIEELESLHVQLQTGFSYSPWVIQYYLYRASQLIHTVEFPNPEPSPIPDQVNSALEAFKALDLRQLLD